MRRLLPIVGVLAALSAVAGAVATSAALAAPDLRSLVLSSDQVGRGYVLQTSADGVGLGAPTLDVCALSFPSESRRLDRIQVGYSTSGAAPAVSNEVVQYRVGGAAQALREAAAVARQCRERTVKGSDGATVTYRVRRLEPRGLPAGSVALSLVATATSGKTRKTIQAVAVYVRSGDTLSGVYAYGGKQEARIALVLRLAAASQTKLAQGVGQIA
jgi:hypothetical protein